MYEIVKKVLQREGLLNFSKIEKIGSGASNIIFKVSNEKTKFIVKLNIDGNESFENEFNSLKYIIKKGFKYCPNPICEGKFKKYNYMIQDFIPGKTLKEDKFSDLQVIKMAKFFHNLHSIKFKRHGKIPNPKKTKYSLYGVIDYAESVINSLSNKTLSIDELDDLNNILKKAKKVIIAANNLFLDEINFSLRHGDANPLNFIENKDAIVGIDWVWACVAPPSKEIADFFNKSNINEKQKQLFYKNYHIIDKKKIDAHSLYSYLGTAIWSLDRLDKISKNKLDKQLYVSIRNEKEMYLKQIEKLKVYIKKN